MPMWDNVRQLRVAANALFAAAGALLACGLMHQIVQLPVFAIRGIDVSGETGHVTREQIQAVIARELRGNFFTVDLAQARAAFEKLPWVRQVDISRVWPDRIGLIVEEHRPIARWGSTALVSEEGVVFEAAINSVLPVFTGPAGTAPEVAARFRECETLLAPIGRRVAQIHLSARRAWQLRLDDGMVIELGREAIQTRLAGFVQAYARTVAGLAAPPAYVDLRYTNGFSVRGGKSAADPDRV